MNERKLDPIVSRFETDRQADAYGRWLNGKVERVLNSGSRPIPHEEVVARAARRRAELLDGLKNEG